MYTPAAFGENDPAKIHEFIRRHSFAAVVTNGPGGMVASHLPVLLEAGAGPNGTLFGHMARANPQWRSAAGEALVVFGGPHAYISPSWYQEAGTVPTWNYAAVHAYGPFEVVEDRDAILDVLRRSVLAYDDAWAFDESAPWIEGLLRAIVGFRIEIGRLEGKWKLSQNHPEPRRRRVIDGLRTRVDDDSRDVADMMEERMAPQ